MEHPKGLTDFAIETLSYPRASDTKRLSQRKLGARVTHSDMRYVDW